jgi:hypothetical protein
MSESTPILIVEAALPRRIAGIDRAAAPVSKVRRRIGMDVSNLLFDLSLALAVGTGTVNHAARLARLAHHA